MNTVGAAAFIVAAYAYLRIYTYVMAYYTYTKYIMYV